MTDHFQCIRQESTGSLSTKTLAPGPRPARHPLECHILRQPHIGPSRPPSPTLSSLFSPTSQSNLGPRSVHPALSWPARPSTPSLIRDTRLPQQWVDCPRYRASLAAPSIGPSDAPTWTSTESYSQGSRNEGVSIASSLLSSHPYGIQRGLWAQRERSSYGLSFLLLLCSFVPFPPLPISSSSCAVIYAPQFKTGLPYTASPTASLQ